MQQGILAAKIQQLYKDGDDATLRLLIVKMLSDVREAVVSELSKAMSESDGKLRLKILEILIEDGGPDLIPLFIERILAEKNLLYAKSMVNIYANFEHQQALDALQAIEGDMYGELKSTYARTISKLKAKFRENFYIEEFESGNQKRMKNAAQAMLKDPNPIYCTYLEKNISEQRADFELETLPLLGELGELNTLPILSKYLEVIGRRRRKVTHFRQFVNAYRKQNFDIEHGLSLAAEALKMSGDSLKNLWVEAKSGNKDAFIQTFNEGFQFRHTEIAREVASFWRKQMAGSPITTPDLNRLDQALEQYSDQLTALLHEAIPALGKIAERTDAPDMLSIIDGAIPEDEPDRPRLMLAVYRGFQSEISRSRLLEALRARDSSVQISALEGLTYYEFEDPPGPVADLLLRSDNPGVRKAALSVVGRSCKNASVVLRLLEMDDPHKRADAIWFADEFHHPDAYPGLLKLLQEEKTNKARLALLSALQHYPNAETIPTLVDLIQSSEPLPVRTAALETLLFTPGLDGFDRFIDLVKPAEEGRHADLLVQALSFMRERPLKELEKGFYNNRPFWLDCLDHPNERLREKLLTVLERLRWRLEEEERQAWLGGLAGAVKSMPGKRGAQEEKRLMSLITALNTKFKAVNKQARYNSMLESILELLRKDDHYAKTQAMRKLSMFFKPQILEEHPEQKTELLGRISNFLKANQGAPDLLMIAVAVIGKIDDPGLQEQIKPLIRHENNNLAEAARRALGLDKKSANGQIQRIYIVDDSRYITQQLGNVLREAGYQVDVENNAKQALAYLETEKFDLLIIDHEMPDISGDSFVKSAREAEISPDKIIMLASTRDRVSLASILQLGVDGLLLKPFPIESLLNKIQEISLQSGAA